MTHMSWIKSIYCWFRRGEGEEERAAGAKFDQLYPHWKRISCRIMNREGSVTVVAVFYSAGLPARPMPYKVFTVDSASREIREADTFDPQYAIKGRK